jgi:hypothetical protein
MGNGTEWSDGPTEDKLTYQMAHTGGSQGPLNFLNETENTMIRNAAAQTNFGHADDRLSRLTSELLEVVRSENDGFEDMRAFGAPSECGSMIHNSAIQQRDFVLARHGIQSMDEALAMVEERTSGYWVYLSGLVAIA